MSFEANVQRLSQAALEFAERVLQAVVTEGGHPASSERLDELFELCSQALQYAIMLESVTLEALPFVESLRDYSDKWLVLLDYHCLLKVKAEIEQFAEGLKSLGCWKW